MKKLESVLAEQLINIGAILLQPDSPFTWASGWASPIYTDNRLTLSYPRVRNLIKVEMARVIMENLPDAEVIAGVATGAIAQGALVADSLGMPFVYVRSTPKDHGLENLIEGNIMPGQRVVLIEDQLSTGNNCMKSCDTVSDAGGIVQGVVVMFDYQFPTAAKALKRRHVPVIALTDFDTMLKVAVEQSTITADDALVLRDWHTDPEAWTPASLDGVE